MENDICGWGLAKSISDLTGRIFLSAGVSLRSDYTDVASALTKIIEPYRVHTRVVLNTGEIAVVRKLNPGALDRPVASAVADKDGHPYRDYVEYNQRGKAAVHLPSARA